MGSWTPPAPIDLDRYPLDALDSSPAREVIAEQRRSLAERGVAILPEFASADAIAAMAAEAAALKTQAHLEDVWGTPYLELPDESSPEGHPRRTSVHGLTWVIAYDLVVSLAVQSSVAGGEFEYAPFIRSPAEENYGAVARVLAGEGADLLEVLRMTPGTLMIFAGRNSIHRVSPVRGGVPRKVALLAYDTKPGTDSSELCKLVRYGRSEPLPAAG